MNRSTNANKYDVESASIIIDKHNQAMFRDENLAKHDGRLFPEYLLYCEGMPRPVLRGMLHLFCALLFPVALFHLLNEANGSTNGQIAACIYLCSNLCCVGISALYHVGRWSPKTEILLQKLDHAGIAIFSAGTNIPVSILLLPYNYGVTLAFLSCASCLWACWHVANLRPGVWRLVVVASMILPFFPQLYQEMSVFEFQCVIANTVFQIVGAVIFTNQCPDPAPKVFGYHEIFHVFTGFGILSIYLCNWSVIRRTCNPYAHVTDVSELLQNIAVEFLSRM